MNLPPANWYDDPTDPTMERWWDGEKWTEHRRPAVPAYAGGAASHQAGELRPVGDMIGHAFSLIRARLGGIIGVGVIAAVAIAIAYGVFILAAFGLAFETNAGELFETNTDAIVLLVFLFVVAGVLSVASFLATTTLLWDAAVGRKRSWGAAFGNGFRRMFPFLGWIILGSLPIYALILFAFAIGGGTEGGAIGFIFVVFMIPWIYWSVVLYFVPVTVVRETGDNALVASFQLVKGRWWRIFGRMLVWGLVMIGVGIGLGIVFSLVAAAVGSDGGPLGAIIAIATAAVGLTAFFLYYALQAAPVVSMTYDLVGDGSRPTGAPTAEV
ncbi:MAG: DUF2510 domain-containing protein [Acidimicrobiia bacterium]|nr:DUF2510 domain-containing protein [Acidimicrobiia bacterium]